MGRLAGKRSRAEIASARYSYARARFKTASGDVEAEYQFRTERGKRAWTADTTKFAEWEIVDKIDKAGTGPKGKNLAQSIWAAPTMTYCAFLLENPETKDKYLRKLTRLHADAAAWANKNFPGLKPIVRAGGVAKQMQRSEAQSGHKGYFSEERERYRALFFRTNSNDEPLVDSGSEYWSQEDQSRVERAVQDQLDRAAERERAMSASGRLNCVLDDFVKLWRKLDFPDPGKQRDTLIARLRNHIAQAEEKTKDT